MKNYSYFVITIVLIGELFYSANILSQTISPEKADSEIVSINSAMRFEIALDKTEYLQLEPISIKCQFSNETNKPQTTIVPSFLKESQMEVNLNGESKQFNSLSIFTGLLRRTPVTIEAGNAFGEEITLETNLDEFFPVPGTYTIRLVIAGSKGKLLRSNSVKLTIFEPTGINKEAYDFIQRNKVHWRHPVLFYWDNDIKGEDGKTLLEEFVSKYSESIYGEAAIYQLGNYYFRNDEYEKAEVELQKLKFSRNPRIAKDARATLSDVQKNIGTKEKEKPQ
jgi:hypothetical protein